MGRWDYWATPVEIGARTRDCELRDPRYGSFAMPASRLTNCIVPRDTRRASTMRFAVHLDGQRYILDNLLQRAV